MKLSFTQTSQTSLLKGVPDVPTCPTCLTCPRALHALLAPVPKDILQTEKLKISVLMKSNEGLFTGVFKGVEFYFRL